MYKRFVITRVIMETNTNNSEIFFHVIKKKNFFAGTPIIYQTTNMEYIRGTF